MSGRNKEDTPRAPDAWLVTTRPDTQFALSDPSILPGSVHHAEPLFTLPNALRALAEDDMYAQVLKYQAMQLQSALLAFADELDNPEPPIPPEPSGDVMVVDRANNVWMPDDPGLWRRRAATTQRVWSALWLELGPLKVYEAKP